MKLTTEERATTLLADLEKARKAKVAELYARYPAYCNEDDVQHDKEEDNARCLGLDQTPYNY